MEWLVGIITAVGGLIVGVLGAWGLMRTRLSSARVDEAAAAGKLNRENAAATTRANKSALDEAFRLLDVRRQEHDEDRQLIHGLRNESVTISNRLAVCEFERARMREELADLRAAVEGAGIMVRHRPGPVEPYGPQPPAGEAAGE